MIKIETEKFQFKIILGATVKFRPFTLSRRQAVCIEKVVSDFLSAELTCYRKV